jgi:transcriptional regulator with XRE-family HTH domain
MNKQFSIRLGEAIEALGVNPTEFARKAKIPQGTVSKCLNGHVPTARILMRLAKSTGKSVDWMLGGTGRASAGESRVAEQPARYGRTGAAPGAAAGEDVWLDKLRKVLRSGKPREKQMVKDVLDILSR